MHYLDLDYDKQQYLIILYSSIFKEIESGVSHGNVVRHLIRDGSSMSESEDLYKYIKENKVTVVELIYKMEQNLKKIKLEYDINISRQLAKFPDDYFKKQKEMEENNKKVLHLGVHLIEHLIASFFH